MAQLTIQLFGDFAAHHGQAELNKFRTIKVQALLIYLIIEHKAAQRREVLFDLLWPGLPQQSAQVNLRQTLYQLDKMLRGVTDRNGVEIPLLLRENRSLQLHPALDLAVDVYDFGRLLTTNITHDHSDLRSCQACHERLQAAIALYDGALLNGFYLADSNVFEEWAANQRAIYQRQYFDALATMTTVSLHNGNHAAALQYAHQQLAHDKLRESAHRQLMEALAYSGQHGAAIEQYDACCGLLHDELGMSPTRLTVQLAEQIRAGELDLAVGVFLQRKMEYQSPVERPSNLPEWKDERLIGRNDELDLIRQHLSTPSTRLLTLLGAGGIGKTHLALGAAHLIFKDDFSSFRDGVFRLELTEDGGTLIALITQIAQLLDVPLAGQRQPQRYLSEQLQRRECLLVIDNGEWLAAPALHWLDRLIDTSQALHLLVTSRKRLNMRNETVLTLKGLHFPSGEDYSVKSYAAIDLFEARARQVEVQFEADRDAIALIARLTDGLPLALELAASWVRLLSCAEIVIEIEKSLAILSTTLGNVPARHRSMQIVFEQSWRLLDEEAQDMLSRLAVFHGSFDLKSAETITNASTAVLARLTDYALLQRRQYESGTLFSLHPLLHQFLHEQTPIDEALAAKHSHFYADLLESLLPKLDGNKMQEAFTQLDRHLDDIRGGWSWVVQEREVSLIGRYARALHDLLTVRGWSLLGSEMLQQAAKGITNVTQLAQLSENETSTWATLFARLGNFLIDTGQLTEAESVLQISHRLAGRIEDEIELRFVYMRFAHLSIKRGEWADAERLLSLCKQMADAAPLVMGNHRLAEGTVAFHYGKYEEARTLLIESVELFQQAGTMWGVGHALRWLGTTELRLENYDAADQHLNASKNIHHEQRDMLGLAMALCQHGQIARYRNEMDSAATFLNEGLIHAEAVGNETVQTMIRIEQACLHCQIAEYQRAKLCLQSTLQRVLVLEQMPLLLNVVSVLARWAVCIEHDDNKKVQQLVATVLLHPNASVPVRATLSEFLRKQNFEAVQIIAPILSLETIEKVAMNLLTINVEDT